MYCCCDPGLRRAQLRALSYSATAYALWMVAAGPSATQRVMGLTWQCARAVSYGWQSYEAFARGSGVQTTDAAAICEREPISTSHKT